jgi:hypothetical protein
MRILTALILSTQIASCFTKEQKVILQDTVIDCDKIEIIFNTPNDTLLYSAVDPVELKIFAELISLANENIGDSCHPSGKLLYKRNKAVVLEASFSTSGSNHKKSCDYISYISNGHSYTHRLTYSAGMFIDDVYSQMNNR